MNPMNNKPENPPAFPNEVLSRYEGLTMSDYFAAHVIGPLISSDGFEQHVMWKQQVMWKHQIKPGDLAEFAAQTAYEIAEAMLKERSK